MHPRGLQTRLFTAKQVHTNEQGYGFLGFRFHSRPVPRNKLSETERTQVLALVNEPRFASLPPTQIVPKLADEGQYLASESSFYRLLREAD